METSKIGNYRYDLDVIKGIAIIAVVLFHLGIIKSGYLGVDTFLVINGFLIIPSICRKIVSEEFSYWGFLMSRFRRLWPLVVLLSLICITIGYVGMLPDDYENLGESVVASNLFSENILLSITTKDYWNVSNEFNPLIHLWYVGIIMEFYVLFPFIMMLTKRAGGGKFDNLTIVFRIIISVLFAISLSLFLFPNFDYATKFYYIPFRLFEFLLGGICGLLAVKGSSVNRMFYFTLIALLCCVLFSSIIYFGFYNIGTDVLKIGGENQIPAKTLILPKQIMLLVTVALTALVIVQGSKSIVFKHGILAFFGKRSYSIFIWHQALIAFYRYFVSTKVTIGFLIVFFLLLLLVTELSYELVEKRFAKAKYSLSITIMMSILAIAVGGFVYLRAGVVRDVPELDVYINNAQRGMHAAYVDRIYQYDKDFPKRNGKINVIVEGISYGRDMANVLLESTYADSINLSYVFKWNPKYVNRIKNADWIFTFKRRDEVPDYVINSMSGHCELWGIGTKNYGNCNGAIYSKRGSSDYYSQIVELHPWYRAKNDEWKRSWGDHYIDFIEPALTDANHIRVFTDNKKYISQDCYHLTQSGAQWYASIIDFSKIFK